MKLLKSCAAMALLIASSSAFAVNSGNVQVIVKGTIAGSTCMIVSDTQTIDLGNTGVAVLGTSNSAWVWTMFSIKLERCPTIMNKATITISGEPDPDNPLYFKNLAVQGSSSDEIATRVAFQLAPQIGYDALSNGSKLDTVIDTTSHSGQFDLKARMITPTGRATAGRFAGHLDYVIEYQ